MSLLGDLLDIREAFSGGAPPAANAVGDARKALGSKYRPPAPGPAAGRGGFDESKHKRGAAGSSQGGKFIASGSSGVNVTAVQHRVGAKADGKFGSQTQQRVRDFQQRHGLKVDGVVGRQTALALAGHYRQAKATAPGALTKASASHLRSIRKGGASARARHRRPPTRTAGGLKV